MSRKKENEDTGAFDKLRYCIHMSNHLLAVSYFAYAGGYDFMSDEEFEILRTLSAKAEEGLAKIGNDILKGE